MIAKSLYIVHSKTIGLGEKPFLPKEKVNPAFQGIFCNEHCFTDLHTIFYKADRPISLPSEPFIKGIGQICFNKHSVNIRARNTSSLIERVVTGRREYWLPNAKLEPINDYYYENGA